MENIQDLIKRIDELSEEIRTAEEDLSEAKLITVNEGGEQGYDKFGENTAWRVCEMKFRKAEYLEELENRLGEIIDEGEQDEVIIKYL